MISYGDISLTPRKPDFSNMLVGDEIRFINPENALSIRRSAYRKARKEGWAIRTKKKGDEFIIKRVA